MSSLISKVGIDEDRLSSVVDHTTIDVTPIMNMFVILIPFLVSMAVFSHLSVLQFVLPPDSGSGQGPAKEELPITVAVTPEEIALTRGANILWSVPRKAGTAPFDRLTANLRTMHDTLTQSNDTVVIAVDDEVIFDDVIQCMDACRYAGFTEIGLAAGTKLDAAGLGFLEDASR